MARRTMVCGGSNVYTYMKMMNQCRKREAPEGRWSKEPRASASPDGRDKCPGGIRAETTVVRECSLDSIGAIETVSRETHRRAEHGTGPV